MALDHEGSTVVASRYLDDGAREAEQDETFDEAEVNELAAELLSVSNQQEFDYFLGDLIKKAGKAVGKAVRSPLGKQLGGMLKTAAKKALPVAGGIVGNAILPGAGGAVGSKLGSMASSMFGLELEGLSPEDRQFEAAKQFVRFSGDAAKRAVSLAEQGVPPPAAATKAVKQAALEAHLDKLRRDLKCRLDEFSRWIEGPAGAAASPEEAQRRFTVLRLEFNRVLTHVDIFSEALSQRSEPDTGLCLSGLEVVARDALALPGYFSPPPVLCYLARGPGAAIRRARTRLPGGGENPDLMDQRRGEAAPDHALASSGRTSMIPTPCPGCGCV